MNTNKTVLITGGAGFIGCALSQELASSAARWVVVDSLHPQVHPDRVRPEGLHASAELVTGDITESATWDGVLAHVRPDIVIHLAAETGTAQSLDEASRHAAVNVVGTTRMLDAFGRHGIVPDRILLSSSRAVYGEGRWLSAAGDVRYPGQRSHAQLERAAWDFEGLTPVPARAADNVPVPTSVYGSTKLSQEQILAAWVGARDTALTILRLQNVYGPGQSLTNSYTGIVSLFSQLARAGQSIPIYEDGEITRDFVFIDDVAAAFVATLRTARSIGTATFDVGSGAPSTINELARAIAQYHAAPEPHITGAFRDGDVRFAACDVAPTSAALNWQPRWGLDAGIARLQEWIDAQLASPAEMLVAG
ncbi:NAD-dependent epimerase/dehydratase family protein [Curtobacterium sp. YC1]|uniref:NAD-dependent epimerase/dehydratase family protein n=1 Tax=Curtobacterium sp. YC1 TaxID=2795488 RepID=UPI0018E4EDA4|nr:NAD-dependent epimerase/dehydratase family protein [Curtobacterium sp. YC1]QQD76600.1 NAD-dependent epimerase/dehydratase family protein [Curtobacterium sp. YC1]